MLQKDRNINLSNFAGPKPEVYYLKSAKLEAQRNSYIRPGQKFTLHLNLRCFLSLRCWVIHLLPFQNFAELA